VDHRAGLDCGDPAELPEPYRLEITGDAEGAASWWQERGCAYDAALALALAGPVTGPRCVARWTCYAGLALTRRRRPWRGGCAPSGNKAYRAARGRPPRRILRA
jgi:hypothetical protein